LVPYVESRSWGSWIGEGAFLAAGVVLAGIGVIGTVFFPEDFSLRNVGGFAALITSFDLLAWSTAWWPVTRAEMLQATPVKVLGTSLYFPTRPVRDLVHPSAIQLGSLSYVIAWADVGDGLLHLIAVDRTGTWRDRTYRRKYSLVAYRSTIDALAGVVPVLDASKASQVARMRMLSEGSIPGAGSFVVPIVVLVLAVSAGLTAGSAAYTPLLSVSGVLLAFCLVSMPLLRRRRTRCLSWILNDMLESKRQTLE